MTLYLTFEAIEKGDIRMDMDLKVSRTAANRSPSRLDVKAGQTISVENAIKALIVKSANDCATVLAEALAKDEAEFAVLMTKKAKKLGYVWQKPLRFPKVRPDPLQREQTLYYPYVSTRYLFQ